MKMFYPGTFDPITRGHLNVIRRASKFGSEVIVGIAHTPNHKTPTLPANLRKELVQAAVQDLDNVSVVFYDLEGMYMARELECDALLRGIRSGSDFEYEQKYAQRFCEEQDLQDRVETIFVATCDNHGKTSSTMVRDLILQDGNWRYLVPLTTISILEKHLALFTHGG